MSVNVVVHGKGRPLVLFHGWGFDVRIWHSLLPRLVAQYQLYLVDLPGFGLTPSMEWDSFQLALLKQLPSRFALAGWSMGGLCATKLAIDASTRVSHLVNIASSPRFIRDKGWPGVDGKIFTAFYHDLANNPQQTLDAFIQLQLQRQSMPPAVLGDTPSASLDRHAHLSVVPAKAGIHPSNPIDVNLGMDPPLRGDDSLKGSVFTRRGINIDGLRSGLDLLVNWDLREELTQLNMSVLYMFGRLDAITSRKTMATMQTMYPHFDYEMFATAAHVPFLSHPDEFITVLDEFLQ